MGTRVAISGLGTATSGSLAIAFTGAPPQGGDKVIVAFWALFSSTPGISSVQDNAGNVFSEATDGTNTGHTIIGNVAGLWVYFADLPLSATWSGNYTVTVTWTGGTITHSAGAAVAEGGLTNGQATAVHHAQSSGGSAAVASGAISPSGSGCYVGAFADTTSTNPATITPSGNLADLVTSSAGGSQAVGALADLPEGTGSQNATWTIDNSPWLAVIAFWPDAATAALTLTPSLLVAVADGEDFEGSWPAFGNPQPAATIVAPLGQQASAGSVSVTFATDALPPFLPVQQLTLPALSKAFADSAAVQMVAGHKTIYLIVDTILQWSSSGQVTWQPFVALTAFTAINGSSSQLGVNQVLLGSAQNLGGAAATSLAAGLYRLSPATIADLQWPDAYLGMELAFPSAITSGAARLFVVGAE